MKKRDISLILIVVTFLLIGCKYDFVLPAVVPPTTVDNGGKPISLATQLIPIFAEKCNSCHSSQAPTMNAASAYGQLVPGYVNTGAPASSKLYVNSASGSHYAKVSAAQAALILQWITEGAKNN